MEDPLRLQTWRPEAVFERVSGRYADLRITTRSMSLGPRRAYSRLYARLPSKRDINQCRDSLTNQGIGVQQTGAQRLTGASFPQRSMVRGINEQVARGIPRCTWTIRRPVIHERLQEMREMYNGRETTSIRKNKVINEGIRPSAFSELLNVRVGCEIRERERGGRDWSTLNVETMIDGFRGSTIAAVRRLWERA